MNAAGVLHRYHAKSDDVDNDLHLVVGHQPGAPAGALARATAAVRDKLAADPADLAISLSDVAIVAADSHTLAPPVYVSGIPAAAADVLALVP
jgi:predicted TPR repeat methyltransferase